MNHEHYILDGRNVVATDLLTWGRWLQADRKKRVIKQEIVGEYWVSTVFLGLDHQFGDGPPLLFETMVFDNTAADQAPMNEHHCERCSTYDEAEAHARITTNIQAGKAFDDEA
jgi:hypothetical protein